MGRLVECSASLFHPFGCPAQDLVNGGWRNAEQGASFRRIAEKSRVGFLADRVRRAAQQFAELHGQVAHGQNAGACKVQGERRILGQAQRAEDHVVGVALPDAVEITHRHIDRLTSMNLAGNVQEDAVAQLHSVV